MSEKHLEALMNLNRKRGEILGISWMATNLCRKMESDVIVQAYPDREEVYVIPKSKIKIEERGIVGMTVMTMSDEDARLYCDNSWGSEWQDVIPPTDAELDMVKLGLGCFRVIDGKTVFVPKK